MDKKVEKFKSDFKDIKARVKLIKQKLRGIRKEATSVTKAANSLYARGEETMYTEEGSSTWKVWTPKFSGLDDMMEDLERFKWLDTIILQAIDNMP